MRQIIATTLMLFLLCSATACGKTSSEVFEPLNAESKDATEITAQANAEVYQLLDFSDEQESECSHKCKSKPLAQYAVQYPLWTVSGLG